tara:strand:- start:151 stop:309 length:159 start_codon:yes stop_codon:yes gene_type:complete
MSFINKVKMTFSPSNKNTSKMCFAMSGDESYKEAMNIVITVSVKYGAKFSTI